MTRAQKVAAAARSNPNGIRLADLVHLLGAMGYVLARQKGSHQIYTRAGFPMLNVQSDKGMAKGYQVKQVIKVLDENGVVLPAPAKEEE